MNNCLHRGNVTQGQQSRFVAKQTVVGEFTALLKTIQIPDIRAFILSWFCLSFCFNYLSTRYIIISNHYFLADVNLPLLVFAPAVTL